MLTTNGNRVDLSEVSAADLKAELATLTAHLNAGMCRFLELVERFGLQVGVPLSGGWKP